MINKNQIIKKNVEQVRVYNELIEGLKAIKPAFKEFDGKVINIKLERLVKGRLTQEGLFASLQSDWSNTKVIVLRNQNRGYKSLDGEYFKYVDSDSVSVNLPDRRLDANETIQSIDIEIERLERRCRALLKANKDIDKIEKEYNDIVNRIKQFNDNTPYVLREYYRFDRI